MFPTIWARADFADSIKIMLCSDVAVVDVEHSLTRITCFDCSQYVDATVRKIASVGDDYLETDVRSANSGKYVTDYHEKLPATSVRTVPVLE
jgi:hypothetical protein